PGIGNSSHLASELFKQRAGVDMTHIPYKGDVPAITDLISGEVQVMFATAGVIQPHIQAGRVKALGVGGARRLPSMPDLPTISEAGLEDFEASAWFGLSTRAGVDPAIIERLNTELNATLKEPAVVEHFERLNATTVGGSAQDYGNFVNAEAKKWGSLVKSLGLKVE
ncbi:MAG: Bug family tripartite tricarboxylate transporter substrate binding protein, partial [Pigmentiphaga sp.]